MNSVTAQFVSRLVASGLAAEEEAQAWLDEPALEGALNDGRIAAELVKRQRLTGFQAECLTCDPPARLIYGRYVLLDRIGEGGMGQVFKARHAHLERLAAIKLLHEHALDSPEAVSRFRQEVKTAGRLKHPNIVLAYDADEVDGRQFLVMEYVDGRDLGRIARDRPPTIEQACEWILQAARGLAHAHEAGVIHRDIKPSNLLLDSAGVVKVLDMGIARVQCEAPPAGDDTTETQLTQAGVIIGTVDFMAPEQAVSLRHADARSDIYSLGCTFFQILVGRPAFDGATVIEKIIAHRERELPSLCELRPDAGAALEAIVERMVAKRPEDRFQSMTDVVLELQRFLATNSSSLAVTANFVEPMPAAPAQSTIRTPAVTSRIDATAERERDLQRLIDGCGAVDSFFASEEENHLFRAATAIGSSLEEIEAALARTCRERGWTRQTELSKELAAKLGEAAGRDAIDQAEFDSIVSFAVKRKMPRSAALEHCVTLVLDNGWPVKEGLFDKWFARLCRHYGLR
jgi:serine/threonine protein kinase